MRDLVRRLGALEARPANRGFRRVVIVAPGDTAPVDSDDVHIIRIVGVERGVDGELVEVAA